MDDPDRLAAIDNLLASLFNWTATSDFRAAEASLDNAIGCAFRERRYKPWREAWVLGRLAEHEAAGAVRLVRENQSSPDGQICLDGGIIDVEVTEIVETGRRPGAEQKCRLPEDDDVERWRARLAAMPMQLDQAAEKKSKKPYSSRAILAIYLNPGGTYGVGQVQAEGTIRSCIQTWSPRFRAVRVLWNESWY